MNTVKLKTPKYNNFIWILIGIVYLVIVSHLESSGVISTAWVQFIPAGLSLLSGIGQRFKANRLESQNKMPTATVNSNIAKNQALAQSLAKQGLPSPVYNNQLNQMQQGFSSAFRNMGQRSTNGTNVNAFLRNYNNGLMNLNSQDAQARQQNQQTLMNANSAMAQEEQRVWNWNQAQPYLRNAQNISQLRNAGNQNIISGVSGAVNTQMMNQYFRNNGNNGFFGMNNNGGNGGYNASLYNFGQGVIS